MLARMRPVVSRPARSQARVIGLACILAVLAAACGGAIPASEVQTPEGRTFIPLVPDSIDNVGLAPSVAVDAQGLPVISYFGFPAVLEEGEIPVARPVGSPFLTTEDGDDAGAVLLASVTPDQIWTRGAVAQPRETPGGVPVPFEPVEELSLASLTPADAAGTDIAIAGTDIHAVWTTDVGVFYGLGPPVRERARGGDPRGRCALDRGRRRRRTDRRLHGRRTRARGPGRRAGGGRLDDHTGDDAHAMRRGMLASHPGGARRRRTARRRDRPGLGRRDRGTAAG